MSCIKLNLQNSANSNSSSVLNDQKNRELYKIHDNKNNVPNFDKNELNKMPQVQYNKFKLWQVNRFSQSQRPAGCPNNYFYPK